MSAAGAAGVHVTENIVLKRRLGEGGMGTVWLAEHRGLRKDVVVKLMSDHVIADENLRQRFAQEAAAAANVKSPHVVHVLDTGVSAELGPYIVMESLEGEDLAVRLARQSTLPSRDVVRVVAHAAHALDRAHALGIVHRDVKPGNLFLCADAEGPFVLKVLDFGVAQWRSEAPLTAVGVAVGTPTYMSPEQAAGQELDGRSDLYSLALVAFRALTGVPAVTRESFEALGGGVVNLPLPKPTDRRAELPAAVDAWFARAAARDRSARYPDGATMAAELARALGLSAAAPESDATVDYAARSLGSAGGQDAPRTGGVTAARPVAASAEPERPTTSLAVERAAQAPAASAPRARRARAGWSVALVAIAAVGAGAWWMRASYTQAPAALPATPSASASAAPANAPIPIGVLLDLSGERRQAGQALLVATTAAVKAVNDGGGVRGRPIRLVVSDDQGDRGAFLEERARALVATQGLKVMLGPMQSSQVVVVAPIAQAAGVLELTGSATSPSLSTLQRPEQRLLFRTVPSQTRSAEALARLMRGEPVRPLAESAPDAATELAGVASPPCTRAAVLAPDDAFGAPFAEAFTPAFKAHGGRGAEVLLVSPVAQVSYAKELAQLARAKVDCQVLAIPPKAAARFLREARADGAASGKLPTFAVGHLASGDFIEHGRANPREPASASVAEGVRGVRPATRLASHPESEELAFLLGAVDAGADTRDAPFVASQFDAAILAALTLEKAGPDADAAGLRQALRAVASGEQVFGPHELPRLLAAIRRGASVNYVGASGNLMFDSNGDVDAELVAWVIRDGKVREYGRVATAAAR